MVGRMTFLLFGTYVAWPFAGNRRFRWDFVLVLVFRVCTYVVRPSMLKVAVRFTVIAYVSMYLLT